jgi:hypothetical protein
MIYVISIDPEDAGHKVSIFYPQFHCELDKRLWDTVILISIRTGSGNTVNYEYYR